MLPGDDTGVLIGKTLLNRESRPEVAQGCVEIPLRAKHVTDLAMADGKVGLETRFSGSEPTSGIASAKGCPKFGQRFERT